MWKIIKYEFEYNWYYSFILIVLFIIYSIMTLVDFQLTTSLGHEFEYWEDVYGIILYIIIVSLWGNRLKEKRIRNHALLPLTERQISQSRFWFVTLPLITIVTYLIIVQLIIIKNWHNTTGDLIGQVGVCFILFAAFIRGRDDWFSYWNFGKRARAAFVAVFIVQILVVAIFTTNSYLNKNIDDIFGTGAVHYANLLFPLLGLIILITTILSYKKRVSYLS